MQEMKRRKFIHIFSLLTVLCTSYLLAGVEKKPVVYKFEIRDEIGPSSWRLTKKAIEEAESLKADYILIHMNTYGGELSAADSIRTKILNTQPTVLVFIDNNAASAGALISIACDKIFMRSTGSIGAATVVTMEAQALPDKYQSYMRSMMRATAEANGRDPRIAEAMVDPDIYIEGIIDSGKVLTFTATEALKHHFCDSIAESIPEALRAAGISEYTMLEYHETFIDKIIGFLINPVVSGLLIMIIVAGIYYEMQAPGIGFPLFASIVAATLYFAPLYLEGMAANWEVLVFISGIILLAVELFVIPGFGIAGVGAIILMITGLTFSLVKNDGFDFSGVETGSISRSLMTVIVSMLLSVIGSIVLGKRMMKTSAFQRMVLTDVQQSSSGYVSADAAALSDLTGKRGIASTILRPSGKVEIGGELYDAVADIGYVEQGEDVEVVKHEGAQLFVRKKKK